MAGFAQTPKAYGPSLGVERAKKLAAVAIAAPQKNHCYIAVAVVDTSGTLIYYEEDGQHSDRRRQGLGRKSTDVSLVQASDESNRDLRRSRYAGRK